MVRQSIKAWWTTCSKLRRLSRRPSRCRHALGLHRVRLYTSSLTVGLRTGSAPGVLLIWTGTVMRLLERVASTAPGAPITRPRASRYGTLYSVLADYVRIGPPCNYQFACSEIHSC